MVERRKRKSELISEEEKQRRAAQLRHSLANPTPVACRFFRTFDQATASVCMTCG